MGTDYVLWGFIAVIALILLKETNILPYFSELTTAAQSTYHAKESFRG